MILLQKLQEWHVSRNLLILGNYSATESQRKENRGSEREKEVAKSMVQCVLFSALLFAFFVLFSLCASVPLWQKNFSPY